MTEDPRPPVHYLVAYAYHNGTDHEIVCANRDMPDDRCPGQGWPKLMDEVDARDFAKVGFDLMADPEDLWLADLWDVRQAEMGRGVRRVRKTSTSL